MILTKVATAAAVLLIVSGCAHDSANDDGRPRVVAAFYPVAWAAEQVGGDRVAVENLTPAGAEPHDLEITSGDVDALQDADVVLIMGSDFQPAVEAIAQRRDTGTVELLSALPIDDVDDPHVWLDPVLMGDVVDVVTDALREADPDGAAAYAANAAAVHDALAALDAEFATGLADCDRDVIVTAHDAFGRMARRYGLRQESIAGIAPDREPSADRIAELSDLVEQDGTTTIFTETLVSPEVAETLAREAGGLKTATLNPLEGLTESERDAGADYLSVMRENLVALRAALGCR